MSQDEVKKYFEIERKKHFDFFLPYYRDKNWLVVQDNINGNSPIDWDVKLEIFVGQYVLVDEKVRKGEFGDFLLELIQDLRTGKLGWFFGNKDWILYSSWKELNNNYPDSLYLIKTKKLKEYIFSLNGFVQTCISAKGWGITWNIKLNWDKLIEKGIAEKLI